MISMSQYRTTCRFWTSSRMRCHFFIPPQSACAQPRTSCPAFGHFTIRLVHHRKTPCRPSPSLGLLFRHTRIYPLPNSSGSHTFVRSPLCLVCLGVKSSATPTRLTDSYVPIGWKMLSMLSTVSNHANTGRTSSGI